ncbi:FAS1 domain-containing protein, partial [Haematococcus lacustris]
LGGGRRLTKERLLALPELKDILSYHIIPGRYLTTDLYNNTPIFTARAVEITPYSDPCMTEGRIMLHDGCVDKPTPDNFTCADQVLYDKCYFPFMTSALAAQWQGGFCQRTCQRCSCAPNSGITCSQVILPDALRP